MTAEIKDGKISVKPVYNGEISELLIDFDLPEENYGFDDVADGIKETVLSWIENDNGVTYENYNANGIGMGAVPFSWSATFVIEFILNF